MRGLVAVVLTLAVAAFSGCVELVGEEDPDVDAAATEADRILDEYNDKAGHIAGIVQDAAGEPLAGAVVDLLTVNVVYSDDEGRFSFIDLSPGEYSLVVSATDYLDAQQSVDIFAGQFARPEVTLEALPTPEPYYTTVSYQGFSGVGVYPFTYDCGCFDGSLDPEGLSEIVFEAELGEDTMPIVSSYDLYWTLDVVNDEEGVSFGGYEASPMRISILPADVEDFVSEPNHFYATLEPQANLLLQTGQEFTGYLTAFYNGVAPEGFSAFAAEQGP